mmetsp:Transcript_1043/g.2593  ORF Transcript_1043/g.2593 Transcript_1043/m.2593 type:complete len:500 (+) Transcript_1043:48-1547(+)
MIKRRFFTSIIVALFVGGVLALGTYLLLISQQAAILYEPSVVQQPAHLASLSETTGYVSEPDFVHAAQIATPAVVHIKAKYEAKVVHTPRSHSPLDQLFREFFGEGFDISPGEHKGLPKHAAGSGVIIASEGYIVTNNHVIEGADQIEVILDDNRQYNAQLVGQDPNTDLALLKIKEKGLPFLQFGNSDILQVGEWILAVGNPFNLTSTVTKGIVSAKARAIDIVQSKNKMRIEAFIQTDAAVNRGNSGGALVNLKGELVGINTAIATHTGNFTGYSFAIPVSIVKKITEDLKKYGAVQRAILGITIIDVDANLAEKEGLKRVSGVYIHDVNRNSAAAAAGMQKGDVIVAINGNKIKNNSQLQEQMARYKPNDKVRITYYRKDQERTVVVTLQSIEEKMPILRKKDTVETGGASFGDLAPAVQKQWGLTGGVRVKMLKAGPWKRAGIKHDFVITRIDGETVENLDQFVNILNRKERGIWVDGVYPNGAKGYYGVNLDDE